MQQNFTWLAKKKTTQKTDVSLCGWRSQKHCPKMWHGEERPQRGAGMDKTQDRNRYQYNYMVLSSVCLTRIHTLKKRKILAWQRPGDWRMELSFWVFTFQLCPLSKTSLSSWAALTETELKSRICSGVLNVVCQFLQTVINLKILKASQGINQHQKGMKTWSMDF